MTALTRFGNRTYTIMSILFMPSIFIFILLMSQTNHVFHAILKSVLIIFMIFITYCRLKSIKVIK